MIVMIWSEKFQDSEQTISLEFYFFYRLNYLQQSFSLTNMDLNIFHKKLPALCKKVILFFLNTLKLLLKISKRYSLEKYF